MVERSVFECSIGKLWRERVYPGTERPKKINGVWVGRRGWGAGDFQEWESQGFKNQWAGCQGHGLGWAAQLILGQIFIVFS